MEQWKRVQRWYSRFEKTDSRRTHDLPSDHYQDEVYAFFQNCYHLKDWLKHDPTTAGSVTEVEDFISSSQNMSLCADLCNGSKHLTLTRHRASPDTKIGKRHFSLGLTTTVSGSVPDEPATISAKYEIEAGGNTYDAFTVATACVDEWEKYLRSTGLL